MLAGVATLAFQVLAARGLMVERFAQFGITWTCLTVVSHTVGAGLEQWTAREATVGHKTFLPVVAVTSLTMGATAATVVGLLLGDLEWATVAAVCAVGLGWLHAAKGTLVGVGRAGPAGVILIVESIIRLAAVPLVGFAWATAAASVSAAVYGAAFRTGLRAPRRRCGAAVFIVEASTVGVGYQLWLGAAPLFVWAAGATSEEVATVYVLFLLAKAPLTLLFGVQTVVLSWLVDSTRDLRAVLGKWAGWAPLAGAVVAAAVAGGLGLPFLIRMMGVGPVAPVMCGLIAGGVVACGLVQLLGQQPAARGRPLVVGKAWLFAVLAGGSAGVVLVPFGMLWTATVGFAVGCAAAAVRTVTGDLFEVQT